MVSEGNGPKERYNMNHFETCLTVPNSMGWFTKDGTKGIGLNLETKEVTVSTFSRAFDISTQVFVTAFVLPKNVANSDFIEMLVADWEEVKS